MGWQAWGIVIFCCILVTWEIHSSASYTAVTRVTPQIPAELLQTQMQQDETALNGCQEITSSGKYVLSQNILGGTTCFTITADNVILDGAGYRIVGDKQMGDYGVHIKYTRNVTIRNMSIEGFEKGIYIEKASATEIKQNTLTANLQGIKIDQNASNNYIEENTLISSGDYAVIIEGTHNFIRKNNIRENFRSIALLNKENTLRENKLIKNVNAFSRIERGTKDLNSDEESQFNITLKNLQGLPCPECDYDVELIPAEKKLMPKKEDSKLLEKFTPTRVGIYSLRVEIKDKDNNTETMKYIYLVNATGKDTANYYLRGKDPTHGQSLSWGALHADSGSLLFDKPSKDEKRTCSDWIQFSPDKLPEYLFGIVKEINVSVTHSNTQPGGFVGVQRFASYDDTVNRNKSIEFTELPRKEEFSFDVDWPLNYFWEWYWMAIKISNTNGFPVVYINKKNPSEAKVSYLYSKTPAIKEMSNTEISFLAATMHDGEAEIVLEGKGITKLIIEMPDPTKRYKVSYDGINCEVESDCLIKRQVDGEIEILLAVESRHAVTIFSTSPII